MANYFFDITYQYPIRILRLCVIKNLETREICSLSEQITPREKMFEEYRV